MRIDIDVAAADFSLRDARCFPIPRPYDVVWGEGDPLGTAPDLQRWGRSLGVRGAFRRFDLGDAAAGHAVVAAIAGAFARWRDSARARARGPERVDRALALEALTELWREILLAPDDLDAERRTRPLVDRGALASDWLGALRRILRRVEARETGEAKVLPLRPLGGADPGAVERVRVELLDASRARKGQLPLLTALNQEWLGAPDRAYAVFELETLLSVATSPPSAARTTELLEWLDPERLHVKTACYILRLEADVSIADSHQLLHAAGFRAREGRPFSRNSVSACASMAKKALSSASSPRSER